MEHSTYIYIVAWENWVGNPHLTLDKTIRHAIDTNAPADACFYDDKNGRWVTYSEITNTVTLKYLNKELKKLGVAVSK